MGRRVVEVERFPWRAFRSDITHCWARPENLDDIADSTICKPENLFLGIGCCLPAILRDIPDFSCRIVRREVESDCHDCEVELEGT